MSGVTAVTEWLDRRRPAPPEALRRRIDDAVGSAAEPAGDTRAVPGHAAVLAAAALDRLDRVIEAPSGRAAALDLLAADALLTYACEAAAEAGPASLDALIGVIGPARLARILASEER